MEALAQRVRPLSLSPVSVRLTRFVGSAYVEGDSVWDRLRVLDAKYGSK